MRAQPVALLWCMLLLRGLVVHAQDGYARQPGFEVLHYDLDLAVSDTGDYVQGQATLQVRLREGQHVRLRLDLRQMTVSGVLVAAVPVAYAYDGRAVNVTLPSVYKTGDTVQVTIAYAGEPQDGLIMRANKFGQRAIFADNWPDRARFWFPGIDHPSDKATVDFHITAPASYNVVANGRCVATHASGVHAQTWHWREVEAIPTYCMVFGAAEFVIDSSRTQALVPVRYYIFPGDAAYARGNLGRVDEMMKFFTARFGEFPYEKLALVQSATRFGGMENASAIFFAENSFGRDHDLEGTAAHEIAHQWFGDAVTPENWLHLWLSEGFATYAEALFSEHADGEEKFREKMRARRESYIQFTQSRPRGPILDSTITDYMQLLNANNYAKGAWVLHMLRRTIGEENFWQGIRQYYARFRNRNATSEDFRAVMAEVSGDSLRWFFKQWLEQPDYPQLQVSWQWLPARRGVEVTLRQTQEPAFYRLPVEIGWHAEEEGKVVAVEMKSREHKAFLPTGRMPEQLDIDPRVNALLSYEVITAPSH